MARALPAALGRSARQARAAPRCDGKRKGEHVTESDTQDRQATALVITRVFDAPREQVWNAWTDPEQFKKWWGPEHFTAPVSEIDLRVGGTYFNCMRSPDGKDY